MTLLALLIVLLAAVPATQAQTETRRDRQRERTTLEDLERHRLQVDLDEVADETLQDFEFDYGGWTRAAYYHFRDNTDKRTFRNFDLRLWSSLVYEDTHQIYMRVYANLTDYNPNDEYYYMDEDDLNVPRLDEGYYYGDLGRAFGFGFDGTLRLKAGRQYVVVGQGLSLDVRGDGGVLEFENEDLKASAFGINSIWSEDSYDRSYVDFGHHKVRFAGLELTGKFSETFEVYGYGIMMTDGRTPIRAETGDQKFQYDAFYLGAGVQGQFGPQLIYHAEYAQQSGRAYPDASTHRSHINAWAYDVGVSYAVTGIEWEPTFHVQHVFGSGDPDMQTTVDTVMGNTALTENNTFFGYGYVDTGFAFFPLISNIHVTRLGFEMLVLNDHDILGDIEIGFNHFQYRKDESRGGISDRGHNPAAQGYHLGHENDIYLLWRPFSDMTITAQYGEFQPNQHLFFDDSGRPFISTSVVFYF